MYFLRPQKKVSSIFRKRFLLGKGSQPTFKHIPRSPWLLGICETWICKDPTKNRGVRAVWNLGVNFKSPKINQKWATFENLTLVENLISQGYSFTNFAPILLLYMSKFSEDQAL